MSMLIWCVHSSSLVNRLNRLDSHPHYIMTEDYSGQLHDLSSPEVHPAWKLFKLRLLTDSETFDDNHWGMAISYYKLYHKCDSTVPARWEEEHDRQYQRPHSCLVMILMLCFLSLIPWQYLRSVEEAPFSYIENSDIRLVTGRRLLLSRCLRSLLTTKLSISFDKIDWLDTDL